MSKKINVSKRVIKDGSNLKGPLSLVKMNKGIDTIAGVTIKHGLNRLSEIDWEKIKGFKLVKININKKFYVVKEAEKSSLPDSIKKEKDKKDKK